MRAEDEGDEPFLFRLYASARAEEMALWGWDAPQQEAFLRMQFSARQRQYALLAPDTERRILIWDGQPVGRAIVHRQAEQIHLIDIALLPEFQGQGIGSHFLRGLLAGASRERKPVCLLVRRDNLRARRLYERLGFFADSSGGTEIDALMRWLPSQQEGQEGYLNDKQTDE